MRVGIFTNLTKDIDGRATKALVDFLSARDAFEVFVCEDLRSLNLNVPVLTNAMLAEKVDIMVVFGGDGTILRIAKECAINRAHIFAVNLGHLGFLAEVENVELSNMFEEIMAMRYTIDERSLIEATTADGNTYTALNEVVFGRGSGAKMLYSEVRVDGALVNRFRSDGIIVSTPTGSTAYSLSAGGPIVAPDVAAMIITPVCPHSLISRPVVVSDDSVITVKLLQTEVNAPQVSVDGEEVVHLSESAQITIRKSNLVLHFIRLKKYNYYEKLLGKMSRWSTIDN